MSCFRRRRFRQPRLLHGVCGHFHTAGWLLLDSKQPVYYSKSPPGTGYNRWQHNHVGLFVLYIKFAASLVILIFFYKQQIAPIVANLSFSKIIYQEDPNGNEQIFVPLVSPFQRRITFWIEPFDKHCENQTLYVSFTCFLGVCLILDSN